MSNDYWGDDNPFEIGHNYGVAMVDIVSTAIAITKLASAVKAAGGLAEYLSLAVRRYAAMPKKMLSLIKDGALQIKDQALITVNKGKLLLYLKDEKYIADAVLAVAPADAKYLCRIDAVVEGGATKQVFLVESPIEGYTIAYDAAGAIGRRLDELEDQLRRALGNQFDEFIADYPQNIDDWSKFADDPELIESWKKFGVQGAGKVAKYPINNFLDFVNSTFTAAQKQLFTKAENFYKNFNPSFDVNELRGIDFDLPVSNVVKQENYIMYQMATIDNTGKPRFGSYFFENVNEDITKLGIGDLNTIKAEKRVKVKIILDDDINFLKSTTANIEDWKGSGAIFEGGGNQYYNPTAKTKIKSFEIIQTY